VMLFNLPEPEHHFRRAVQPMSPARLENFTIVN
jgi:hypothetical protein